MLLIKKQRRSSLRDKFNGKLVMSWTNLKPGPILAEVMFEFETYIENKYGVKLIVYLNKCSKILIMHDFDLMYNELDYKLGIKSDLPF